VDPVTTELPRTEEAEAPRRLGPYELGPRIGEGGMGIVYRAFMPDGRDCAIKVLRPHIAHDEGARARLRREVATLERVHHPNVAAVLDADVDGPSPYLVTEYVPGAPLDVVVAEQGPLPPEALARLGQGLYEALEAIHAVGIVHRDLKPGNVLMVGDDPVVIDFGIAQVSEDVRLTMTGMVMGTPGYLSPEVVEGGSVTEATDWWGWAATLSFAASGQPPFGRGPMSVVLDRVIRGRTQLAEVDPDLRPLLLAALHPDPAHRPGADVVLEALQAYADRRPVEEVLTRHVPSTDHTTSRPTTPDQPWASDRTARTGAQEVVDPTVVQPVAHTRVQPVQRPPQPPPRGPQPGPYPLPPPNGSPYAPPHDPRLGPAQPGPGGGGASPAYPARPGDPRIGRPMRTGTLAALLLLFVAVSAVVPLLAWGLLALWSVLGRWVDRTMTGLVLRRHEAGPRGSDLPMMMLAAPWHLVGAVLGAGLSLLLPVAFAVVAAALTSYGLAMAGVVDIGIEHPVAIGVGSLLGALTTWWGPGGISLRRGSRTIVRAVLPAGVVTQVVVSLLSVGALGLGVWAVLEGQDVSWWPNPGGEPPLVEFLGWTRLE
jgi:serine/threonine protein kinase